MISGSKSRKKGSYLEILNTVDEKKYRYQILIRKRKIEKKVLRVTEID